MGEEVKKASHKNLIIGVIAVAVIVIVLFIPMIPVTVTYSETEPYERLATYVVDDWNLEEKLGWFDVYDVYGLFGSVEDSFYLGAGQSYTSTATFDTSWGQDTLGSYDVTPPTVIDTKLVYKTKTVYKSIIEILIYG